MPTSRNKQWVRMFGATMLSTIALVGCAEQDGAEPEGAREAPPQDGITALSSEQEADLTFLREEEKVARDVYRFLSGQFGLAVFATIAGSEQRHTDALGRLLAAHALPDPMQTDVPGQFEQADLQELHDSLKVEGSQSVEAALNVGALIEEVDILDLEEAMLGLEAGDVLTAYRSLHCGSQNHLRAFTAELEAIGIEAQPQALTQDAFDEILLGATQLCGAR